MDLSLLGVIATVWLVVGVLVAGKRYSGYNHKQQFLSELGASGAPTQRFSPAFNNFPLSVLFTLFGFYLINSVGLVALGICILVHGLGTFVAGVFPMDADPYTRNPSATCKIHSLAGLFMFISLLVASCIAIFTAKLGIIFQLLSAVATLLTLYFTIRLAREYPRKGNVGLFQRLGYGVQMLWLSWLSILLFLH